MIFVVIHMIGKHIILHNTPPPLLAFFNPCNQLKKLLILLKYCFLIVETAIFIYTLNLSRIENVITNLIYKLYYFVSLQLEVSQCTPVTLKSLMFEGSVYFTKCENKLVYRRQLVQFRIIQGLHHLGENRVCFLTSVKFYREQNLFFNFRF